LLYLGERVDERDAEQSLSTRAVELLVERELAERRDGTIRAHVRVQPHDDLLIVHDLALAAGLREDYVAPVAPGSLTLAGLTTRRSVGSTLDLGTGCGVQGLLAARHSDRVVAVDVNPRALELAAAGAVLSGVRNVEWRLGDFFAPVEGERFDLVVSNPPFVLSPERKFLFRDSPEPGDELSRQVVSQLPRFLADGGYGHVMCNWVRRPGEDAAAGPRSWLEGSGCDVWLLHYGTDDAVTYAATWNREPITDPAMLESEIGRWLAPLVAKGIESIATGVVILRRRDGTNWFRADEMPYGPAGSGSDHVLRVFAANDDLATLDDSALLDGRFELADGLWLEERSIARNVRCEFAAAQLRPKQGVGLRGRLSEQVLALVRRLDGSRTLRELLDERHADEQVTAVRELYGAGFLIRAQRHRLH
jgi:methyltransferase family protein